MLSVLSPLKKQKRWVMEPCEDRETARGVHIPPNQCTQSVAGARHPLHARRSPSLTFPSFCLLVPCQCLETQRRGMFTSHAAAAAATLAIVGQRGKGEVEGKPPTAVYFTVHSRQKKTSNERPTRQTPPEDNATRKQIVNIYNVKDFFLV